MITRRANYSKSKETQRNFWRNKTQKIKYAHNEQQLTMILSKISSGETFQGGESGMAVPETVCTSKSVGISVDINTYEPHLLAGTMAHMIGHNIGMGHDDGREDCVCRDWHGCIMAQTIVGSENVQPYKFSECSKTDYVDSLRTGHGICLLNKPNEVRDFFMVVAHLARRDRGVCPPFTWRMSDVYTARIRLLNVWSYRLFYGYIKIVSL